MSLAIAKNLRRLSRRNFIVATPAIHPYVTAWNQQVIYANVGGGATPAGCSTATQLVLSDFYRSMEGAGLLSLMLYVNCYVPDGTAGTGWSTPFINKFSTSLQMGSNGSPTNGVNGVTWAGGGWATVSVNPFLAFTTASMGMTIYGYDLINGSSSIYDFGYLKDDASNMFAVQLRAAGNTILYIQDNVNGKVQVSFPGNGYFSGNRTALNDLRLYWANSTNPHAQIGSTVTTGTAKTLWDNYATMIVGGGWRTDASTAFGVAGTNTHSFFALHPGLTAAQSAQLYTIVQAMRVSFGGGWR